MAPRKSVANGTPVASTSLQKLDVFTSGDTNSNVAGKQVGSLASDPLPDVKVNKANLAEIKGALDDIVKKVRLVHAKYGDKLISSCSI